MDKKPVLAVVLFVGVFSIAALGCVTFLISDGASETAIAVISTPMGVALGILGTLLSSTRYQNGNGQVVAPVQVVNAPDKPVPVDTTATVPDEPAHALVTLADQGIDPALGLGGGEPPKNANATQNP